VSEMPGRELVQLDAVYPVLLHIRHPAPATGDRRRKLFLWSGGEKWLRAMISAFVIVKLLEVWAWALFCATLPQQQKASHQSVMAVSRFSLRRLHGTQNKAPTKKIPA
jgi:hypothetical protein